MLRVQVFESPGGSSAPATDEIDIAVAAVQVSPEDTAHPVEHAFDGDQGPGATRWVAGEPGQQTLILAIDAPQARP